ncbi:hypothetical protein CRM22_003057 [Opisthorchis felineus]|uniref:Queuosine 5'-phosphate N-glycosylase/hydrolase n=1 Tax=Opisthorchis felineus TaxID=147828 RepID=A0A4S2M9B7_OPIFE|nr:hypothetical protein CRM22_003057 [Opisthorchis felineus]
MTSLTSVVRGERFHFGRSNSASYPNSSDADVKPTTLDLLISILVPSGDSELVCIFMGLPRSFKSPWMVLGFCPVILDGLISLPPNMTTLSPALSAEFIVQRAAHVHINPFGIEKLAKELSFALSSGTFGIEKWSCQELTPKIPDDRAIEWIFVTDLLNFSFWTDSSDRQYQVMFNQKVHTGYWALCAAVNRAVEEGFDLLDPNTYQHITEAQLKRILRSVGNVEIPLFTERLRLLRESGKTLVRDFGGSFKNVVRMCEGSAFKLLDMLCEHFPSFKDTAIYESQQVSFLKRAQILVGDLWLCFNGQSVGAFYDIDKITAFADYRVPQVLYYHDVVSYSDKLLDVLRKG